MVIKKGGRASVPVRLFGEEWARERATADPRKVAWYSDELRYTGTVIDTNPQKILIDFEDGEEHHWWARKVCRAEGKTGGNGRSKRALPRTVVVDEENSASDEPESEPGADDESSESEAAADAAENEDCSDEAEPIDGGDLEGWVRDDDSANDERMRHGCWSNNDAKWTPQSTLDGDEDSPQWFFSVCKSWFDEKFIQEMADEMQKAGREKGVKWAAFKVTVDDLWQWIGVWFFMLAFPQHGDRRNYFSGNGQKRFGPRYMVEEWLKRGKNGEKGVTWFENLYLVFTIPKGDTSEDDPFYETRHMWETARIRFNKSITASYLLLLDESMIASQIRGMPGLMVVPRKPTPIGLELHTLCCALSGILCNFEVYEGKEAMEHKEFVHDTTDVPGFGGKINKSTAQTLRCLKPYFSSGRILIADSWFGSVPCALELFKRRIFCVMNVKTATKGYPKKSLLSAVGEIKGQGREAREKRRQRRGRQVAYNKEFKVGRDSCKVTAGGHNKKVPLLLVSTALSMLPGNEHRKQWTTVNARGDSEVHEIITKQPMMHELYRSHMNLVDLHNKLRQGQVSMAEVWRTNSWPMRHFGELLGFTEVNIFKCLHYFRKETWGKMNHNDFRRRLAWAFLTLGQEPFPDDEAAQQDNASTVSSAAPPTSRDSYTSATVGSASALFCGPRVHNVVAINKEKREQHTCGYCGTFGTDKYCETCWQEGYGVVFICGRKSKRDCIDLHQRGAPVQHGSWRCIRKKAEAPAAAASKATASDASTTSPGRQGKGASKRRRGK
jgi:hypothetical protein